MNDGQPVLEIKDLTIEVQSHRGAVFAVKDVSLRIKAGQALGIVGESGCGKSMTCLSILGLLPSAATLVKGSIRLDGRELSGLTSGQLTRVRGKIVSMIVQNPMTAFNPALTIGRQFFETLRLHGKFTRREAREEAVRSLAAMNLTDPERILELYPFELSGGMLQRVMIALSVSTNPSLLIADEPTTALDSRNRVQVIEVLQAIKERREQAILIVSHDLSVIEALADDVIVMKDGRIVESGPLHKLKGNPQHEYTKQLLNARIWVDSKIENRSRTKLDVV